MSSPSEVMDAGEIPPSSDQNSTAGDDDNDEKLQVADPFFAFAEPVFLRAPSPISLPPTSSLGESSVAGSISADTIENVNKPQHHLVQKENAEFEKACQATKDLELEVLLLRIRNMFLEQENGLFKDCRAGVTDKWPSSNPFDLHKPGQYPILKLTPSEIDLVIDHYSMKPNDKFCHYAPTEEEQKTLVHLGQYWVEKEAFTLVFNAPGQSYAHKARALLFSAIKKEAIVFCSVSGNKKSSLHKYTKIESELLLNILEMVPMDHNLEDQQVEDNCNAMIRKSLSVIRKLSFPSMGEDSETK